MIDSSLCWLLVRTETCWIDDDLDQTSRSVSVDLVSMESSCLLWLTWCKKMVVVTKRERER
jgi:hypothetical protein